MRLIDIHSEQLRVSLLDFGARICSIRYQGNELALAYTDIADYQNDSFYMGASIGPITNRIAGSQINIDGNSFRLPANEGENCLHSGGKGFDKRTWKLIKHNTNSATFELVYDMADIGMRGTLTVHALYQVQGSQLMISYLCTTDTNTYINTTNHVYLNLDTQVSDLSHHEFELFGQGYLPVDQTNIPLGVVSQFDSPLIYQLSHRKYFDGLVDHHFEVNNNDTEMACMMRVQSQQSGIGLTVLSNSPGYQLYTGYFLDKPFSQSNGFCVETQYAPDAINQASLYSPLLKSGESREQITLFEFNCSHP